MKYTSGPWEMIGRHIYQTEEAGGRGVLHGASVKGKDEDEIEANIRMIATAPELLAMLEWIHLMLYQNGCILYDEYYNQLDVLIKKAKGE